MRNSQKFIRLRLSSRKSIFFLLYNNIQVKIIVYGVQAVKFPQKLYFEYRNICFDRKDINQTTIADEPL